jgi:acetolactate synthase-1/2/3 large subunit
MQTTGAHALVEALVREGVEVVFGYPGGAIMPVYDALHDAGDRLRHVLVRHEQGATHAAQGYARTAGRPGVCIATSGPGATNLITGLADALMDSTPLVCITGQVAATKLGTEAFQEADVVGLTLAATKWSCQVTDPDAVAPAIARAFEVAVDGRPGPVLVDVTRDAQAGPTGGRTAAAQPWRGSSPATRDVSGLPRAAALLNAAERPYLLLGHGVTLAGAEAAALAVAERCGIPTAATLLGLSAFPVDHPLYVGMLGMHGNYGANALTNEADVILAVGMRFDDRVTGRLDDYAPRAKVIHVDVDPAQINRLVPAEVPVIADARDALEGLLPHLAQARHPEWLARFREHDATEHAEVIAGEMAGHGALRMAEVIDALSSLTAGEAVVVTDVGQHQMVAARHYRFARPGGHITSGGLGTMGFALPAAIGAAIGSNARTANGPHRPVVAVAGDGGIQMTVQELGTLMQEHLPVKVVVLNNEHLGMVRQWQELFFDRRYSHVQMQNPDFVALAGSYRIGAERVESRDDLVPALGRMLAAPGPYLVEVRVGREDNVFPMIPAGASVSEVRLA